MHPDVERILYTEEEIAARVKEMGASITERYKGVEKGSLVVVCALRGAAVFAADLVRAIDLPIEMDYMAVSSYGLGTTSSGNVQIEKDMASALEGRHVLIAEDVLDTGLTLSCLIELLKSKGAASVNVAAMFRKDVKRDVDVECMEVGFDCPNEFLVGYGLDYAELYRNLPYLGVLKPEVYA